MERSVEDLERWAIMVKAGYAWAGSTFRQGGVEVRAAAEDTERLRQIFVGHVAQPRPVLGANGQLLPETISNTNALGQLLYSQYLYPVQIAAVLLLLAIIAAIALTLRSRKDSRYQSPHWQVNVKAADRMRVVKMEPTRAAPQEAAEAPAQQENAS